MGQSATRKQAVALLNGALRGTALQATALQGVIVLRDNKRSAKGRGGTTGLWMVALLLHWDYLYWFISYIAPRVLYLVVRLRSIPPLVYVMISMTKYGEHVAHVTHGTLDAAERRHRSAQD